MAKTLLNGVNEVLKKVQLIQGDSGALTSLTDSARQVYVDSIVQLWNEVTEQLYSESSEELPKEVAEDTITLTTSRSYALATDLLQLKFPLLDETNGRYLEEYPGGYLKMVEDQLVPGNYTGLPLYATISPVDGTLYLDRLPTATETGLIYKYRYDKDISVTAASDTFSFSDAVFRALVPAVAELFKLNHNGQFIDGVFRKSMGRASRLLTQKQQKNQWIKRTPVYYNEDPFE
ncbi:MAG: hypothetical protein ACE5DX_05835 [Candidatus Dojkabacteria bacterium]